MIAKPTVAKIPILKNAASPASNANNNPNTTINVRLIEATSSLGNGRISWISYNKYL